MQQSKFKFPAQVQELQQMIESLEVQQIDNQKIGKYQLAQTLKLTVAEGKRRLESRRLHDMANRQKDERKQLENAHFEELKQFNAFWNAKEAEQAEDAKKASQKLALQHQEQVRKAIKYLEVNLPSKVKQSVELLNLRKMEQHMSKQKRYMDAHQVQARIASLLKQETIEWDRQKQIKLDTKVSQLQDKHNLQTIALQKKIATTHDELNVTRKRELDILQLKYVNIKEDQRAAQQKQQLAFKGQFKSKTSISTNGSRSRQ